MLQWMREAPLSETRICVSATKEQAMQLLRDNPDLNTWQFVSLEEARKGHAARGRGRNLVYGLDNLDLMLGTFFDWPVRFATITDQET